MTDAAPLFVHLGLSKTASTAVQQQMLRHADVLRQRLNFVDPLIGQNTWSEVLVPALFAGGETRSLAGMSASFPIPDKTLDTAIRKEIDGALPADNVKTIISQEGFTDLAVLSTDFTETPIFRNLMQAIGEVDRPKSFVLFVRGQDQWIESMYMQSIKAGETWNVDTFFDVMQTYRLDWHALIDRITELIDFESVNVYPFERYGLNQMGFQNPPHAFFNVLFPGIELGFSNSIGKAFAPSLDPAHVDKAIDANRRLPREEARDLYKRLSNTYFKQPGAEFNLLSDKQRQEILQRYADSNRALISDYMPSVDPALYGA